MISLQFITHHTEKYSYLDSARMALEGGCKWIQLRMKEAPLEEVEAELAKRSNKTGNLKTFHQVDKNS